MKTVDHSYEQALIMHDNVLIHIIMNIIMTPSKNIIYTHICPQESQDVRALVAIKLQRTCTKVERK